MKFLHDSYNRFNARLLIPHFIIQVLDQSGALVVGLNEHSDFML